MWPILQWEVEIHLQSGWQSSRPNWSAQQDPWFVLQSWYSVLELPKPLCNCSHILKKNGGLLNWLHIKNDYKWRCTKWLFIKEWISFAITCALRTRMNHLGGKFVIWDWHKKRLISFLIFFQDCSFLIFEATSEWTFLSPVKLVCVFTSGKTKQQYPAYANKT